MCLFVSILVLVGSLDMVHERISKVVACIVSTNHTIDVLYVIHQIYRYMNVFLRLLQCTLDLIRFKINIIKLINLTSDYK